MNTPSVHRLQLGLPGYLILFAPLAFAPQCQYQFSRPLSPQVFFPISTHFTAPPGIPSTSPELKLNGFARWSLVEQGNLTYDLLSHLRALYAQ